MAKEEKCYIIQKMKMTESSLSYKSYKVLKRIPDTQAYLQKSNVAKSNESWFPANVIPGTVVSDAIVNEKIEARARTSQILRKN